MAKIETIDLKGKDYATVPQRLKEFRSKNPRAVITTKPTITDGTVMFEAHILVDKAEEASAEATGHSYGKMTGDKAFEKQETIAVGRALALLGYLNNGQVATTEEMEEFEEYKQAQFDTVVDEINQASKRDEFAAILAKLTQEQKREATPIINARIKELSNVKAN